MTVRSVAGTKDGVNSFHADTAASLPAGTHWAFVFDDTQTFSINAVVAELKRRLASSSAAKII